MRAHLLTWISLGLCLTWAPSRASAQQPPPADEGALADEEGAAPDPDDEDAPELEPADAPQPEDAAAPEELEVEADEEEPLEPDGPAPRFDLWSRLPLEFELLGPNERDRLDAPGAAYVIRRPTIARTDPLSTGELLGQLPGLYTIAQDPMHLRLNAGTRGLDPRGSRQLLVLEDGVPVASAPYTDGQMLYTTPAERLERVELLGGPAMILYGPRALGGALNLVTTQPPRAFTARGRVTGGSWGRLNLVGSVGDIQGAVGYVLEANYRRFEGPRGMDLEATDIAAKFRLQVSQRAWFGASLSVYDEFSRAGSLGLTQPLWEQQPRQELTPYDRNELRRYAASISHTYLLGEDTLWQTTAWAQRLDGHLQQQRWDRQRLAGRSYERVISAGPPAQAPNDGGALFLRNATSVQDQAIDVQGIESRLTLDIDMGRLGRDELIVGARAMREETATEEMIGGHGGAPAGDLLRDEVIFGQSVAVYGLSRFFLFQERLRVVPGARFELLQSERRVWRAPSNGQPVDLNPPIDEAETTSVVLPGLGASLDVTEWLTAFAGGHRGAALPPARQAIGPDGELAGLGPEISWTYEAGGRAALRDWLRADVTGFWVEVDDLVVADPSRSGELVNAGVSRHLGVESAATFDPLRAVGAPLRAPLRASYTYLRATLEQGWQGNLLGNRVPYAPSHQWAAQAALEHPLGLSAQATGRFVGRRFSDLANAAEPSSDGRAGPLPAHFILDARLAYTYLPWEITVSLVGKNLTDTPYIASRRPAGIQPTGWRELLGGVEANF